MNEQEILDSLRAQANPANVEGMGRFGIQTDQALGVSIPVLRALAKRVGRDHALALKLWNSQIHEARILAALIDEPDRVTEMQMERWVNAFDSWDICDGVCSNLFDRTPFARAKVDEWSGREEEFVKRAGFVLMAALAVHDKQAADESFLSMLPVIHRESVDERNFVKKAVNWALRQIGKRNRNLHVHALRCAEEIKCLESRSARWIASDAIRELTQEKIIQRLKK